MTDEMRGPTGINEMIDRRLQEYFHEECVLISKATLDRQRQELEQTSMRKGVDIGERNLIFMLTKIYEGKLTIKDFNLQSEDGVWTAKLLELVRIVRTNSPHPEEVPSGSEERVD